MPEELEQAIWPYMAQGWQLESRLSSTSVVLAKRRLFGLLGKRRVYLWLDKRARPQVSQMCPKDLFREFAKIVRLRRALHVKVSWTEECTIADRRTPDQFSDLLRREHPQNVRKLAELEESIASMETEISFRNCLENMVSPLKHEVMQCLGRGYELVDHTDSHAVLKRCASGLSGSEKLTLSLDSAGVMQRLGESVATLQDRLDTLISLFKIYRTFRPTPGRGKQVADKQFELDAEIAALAQEMRYLGYRPQLGDHM